MFPHWPRGQGSVRKKKSDDDKFFADLTKAANAWKEEKGKQILPDVIGASQRTIKPIGQKTVRITDDSVSAPKITSEQIAKALGASVGQRLPRRP